jgi:hypothetical protein
MEPQDGIPLRLIDTVVVETLTAVCGAPLENLAVAQLVKKFPVFYKTRSVIFVLQKTLPPASQLDAVHTVPTYF